MIPQLYHTFCAPAAQFLAKNLPAPHEKHFRIVLMAYLWIFEIPAALAQAIPIWIILALTIPAITPWAAVIALMLGLRSHIVSIIIILTGLDCPWSTQPLLPTSIRKPSALERHMVRLAFNELKSNGIPLRMKYVIYDAPKSEMNVSMWGGVLYISSAAATYVHLAAALAHEAYHCFGHDDRWMRAKNCFVHNTYIRAALQLQFQPIILPCNNRLVDMINTIMLFIVEICACCLFILGGGIGFCVTEHIWYQHWREAEFAADAYAQKMGFGRRLIRFLSVCRTPSANSRPFYPSISDRIERLNGLMFLANTPDEAETILKMAVRDLAQQTRCDEHNKCHRDDQSSCD